MADDDGGDWFADAGNDPPPPEPKSLLKKASVAEEAPADGGAAPEGGEAPAGGASGEEKPEEAEGEYLDPDKLLIFKHWIRYVRPSTIIFLLIVQLVLDHNFFNTNTYTITEETIMMM